MGEDQPNEFGICRDFERGTCHRQHCKFYHPEDVTPPVKVPTCKDFQNYGECSRGKTCRFLHLSKKQEADYNETGNLPEHGGNAYVMKPPEQAPPLVDVRHQRAAQPRQQISDIRDVRDVDEVDDIPPGVCKFYVKGDCYQGNACKLIHPADAQRPPPSRSNNRMNPYAAPARHQEVRYPPIHSQLSYRQRSPSPPMLRGGGYGSASTRDRGGRDEEEVETLREENEKLRKKISEFQVQVVQLQKFNDELFNLNKAYKERGHPQRDV